MLTALGHYTIVDLIGEGGMGEVYSAVDSKLGRRVAIKVLPAAVAGHAERRDRLQREARAVAALSHPGIATLYEIGEDAGRMFLVFELVPGQSLRRTIDAGPLELPRALKIGAQIADALAEAHAQGIIHRDIKPENVIVTQRDDAKVLDFGLAKWTRDDAAAPTMIETVLGTAQGTAAYMSPEQALGKTLDHRTDIFSLGIVLHEMVTGRRPFGGPTPAAVSIQIVQDDPPAPSSINRNLPPEVDRVVAKALAKDPANRYTSAADLAADIRAVEPVRASTGVSRARVPARAIAAVAVVVTLALALWLGRSWLPANLGRGNPAAIPVVAVIPLALSDADASHAYFADGLTEDLVTRIGQTPGIKVIGRSAIRESRGRTPRDVARELGAGVVLTGTVRPLGDTVRINLELVDPANNTALWTGEYTRELKDIFAVQAQVAGDVARALRITLQPDIDAKSRRPARLVEPRAYEAYLRGRQAAAQRQIASARRFFEQAIALDATLAEAYAGLTEALHLETILGAPDTSARLERLRWAAARAVEIEPNLPQAQLAAALAAESLRDTLEALKRAIAIDPAYTEGLHHIGDQILDFDPARAIPFYRRALQLDPTMRVNRGDTVWAYSNLGRYDEARHEIDINPDQRAQVRMRPILALNLRRYDEAIAALRELQLIDDGPEFRLTYVYALRLVGQADDAFKEATAIVAKNPGSCEARAALAGLYFEKGLNRTARQMAGSALDAMRDANPGASAVRCAAFSAAAIGDADTAAALLSRIAGNEQLLRGWATEVTGQTRSKWLFRRGLFPWSLVKDHASIAEARKNLDDAYARKRVEIAAVLEGVTPNP